KRLLVAVVLVVAALAVGSFAFGATTTLHLTSAKTALKYNKKTLKAHAGKVTIVMNNPSMVFQHDVAIKLNGKVHKSKLAGHNQTVKLTLTLKPGKYTFYCTVPGHEAAGMKGTLIVSK
ncbi:MAG TPA: plastocyanin/azurin family copper-binding protein, partial [Gaiellaceae bacterium]|nr:plastocyanin/azurin family copper-binding protein [Gaiellaceae bacterium]